NRAMCVQRAVPRCADESKQTHQNNDHPFNSPCEQPRAAALKHFTFFAHNDCFEKDGNCIALWSILWASFVASQCTIRVISSTTRRVRRCVGVGSCKFRRFCRAAFVRALVDFVVVFAIESPHRSSFVVVCCSWIRFASFERCLILARTQLHSPTLFAVTH